MIRAGKLGGGFVVECDCGASGHASQREGIAAAWEAFATGVGAAGCEDCRSAISAGCDETLVDAEPLTRRMASGSLRARWWYDRLSDA